jgi:hypothetical protein
MTFHDDFPEVRHPWNLANGERREHRLIAHFNLLKDMMMTNLNLYRR